MGIVDVDALRFKLPAKSLGEDVVRFGSSWNPQKALFSRRDDVTLANPLGPPVCGWRQVEQALDRAATAIREGEPTQWESISQVVTADLAYSLEIQRTRAKLSGAEGFESFALRVTSIFRREDGEWRVVHRHADPITTPRSADSVLEK